MLLLRAVGHEEACNHKMQRCCGCLPARWMLGVMAFFGTMNVFSLRINLSAAIVAMVDYEGLEAYRSAHQNNGDNLSTVSVSPNVSYEQCGGDVSNITSNFNNSNTGKKFLWDENAQGLCLAAYFYGYICSQILGAWLGRKLGHVRIWGFCLLSASICTLLTPAALDIGFGAFVAVRVAIGLFSGVSFPMMYGMWSMWAPPSERGKLLVLHFAGAPVGSLIVLPLSGFLAKEFGWPAVFYVTGLAGTVWSITWWSLMYDSPAQHPRISIKERAFIESSLGHDTNLKRKANEQLKRSVPWFSLLTSIPLWSIVIAQFANNFAILIFLTMLPTYLRTVLNFDIKTSGALSSIPYIVKMCLFPVAGWTADWVVSKGVKTIYVRKIWTAISTFFPGIALAVASYTGCNVALIMFLFSIPDGLDPFSIPGFKATSMEFAPAYSGIVFAISNSVGMSSGFLAPQIGGAMRAAHRDDPIQGWRSLFWLGAANYFIGGLVFLIFGTSDVQKWAQPKAEAEDRSAKMREESHEMLLRTENARI